MLHVCMYTCMAVKRGLRRKMFPSQQVLPLPSSRPSHPTHTSFYSSMKKRTQIHSFHMSTVFPKANRSSNQNVEKEIKRHGARSCVAYMTF